MSVAPFGGAGGAPPAMNPPQRRETLSHQSNGRFRVMAPNQRRLCKQFRPSVGRFPPTESQSSRYGYPNPFAQMGIDPTRELTRCCVSASVCHRHNLSTRFGEGLLGDLFSYGDGRGDGHRALNDFDSWTNVKRRSVGHCLHMRIAFSQHTHRHSRNVRRGANVARLEATPLWGTSAPKRARD